MPIYRYTTYHCPQCNIDMAQAAKGRRYKSLMQPCPNCSAIIKLNHEVIGWSWNNVLRGIPRETSFSDVLDSRAHLFRVVLSFQWRSHSTVGARQKVRCDHLNRRYWHGRRSGRNVLWRTVDADARRGLHSRRQTVAQILQPESTGRHCTLPRPVATRMGQNSCWPIKRRSTPGTKTG